MWRDRDGDLAAANLPGSYLVGLDLGKRRDFSALTVIERRGVPGTWGRQGDYDVTGLWRLRGIPYTAMPDKVNAAVRGITQAHRDAYFQATGEGRVDGPPIDLVVDQTGVGVAVVDILRDAGLDGLVAITIHGGDAVIEVESNREYRTPKREVAGVIQAALQRRRLRVVDELEHAATLRAEMENFEAKINLTTGHDSYGAAEEWRDGNHDDLVLSVGLALWWGEHRGQTGIDWELVAAARGSWGGLIEVMGGGPRGDW